MNVQNQTKRAHCAAQQNFKKLSKIEVFNVVNSKGMFQFPAILDKIYNAKRVDIVFLTR